MKFAVSTVFALFGLLTATEQALPAGSEEKRAEI